MTTGLRVNARRIIQKKSMQSITEWKRRERGQIAEIREVFGRVLLNVSISRTWFSFKMSLAKKCAANFFGSSRLFWGVCALFLCPKKAKKVPLYLSDESFSGRRSTQRKPTFAWLCKPSMPTRYQASQLGPLPLTTWAFSGSLTRGPFQLRSWPLDDLRASANEVGE